MRIQSCLVGFSLLFLGACSDPLTGGGDGGPASEQAPSSSVGGDSVGGGGTSPAGSIGGECVRSGVCSSKLLAEGLKYVSPIVWAEGAAWAVSDGAVTRFGTAGTTSFKVNTSSSLELAVVAGTVFWDGAGTVEAMKPGQEPRTVFWSSPRPEDFVGSGSRIYFRQGNDLHSEDAATPYGEKIVTLPRVGSADEVQAMTVDGEQTIFWAEADSWGTAPELRIRSLRGGVASTLCSVKSRLTYAIATSATHVIFTDHQAHLMMAVPRAGGEPVQVADNQEDTYKIVSDDTGIYWLSRQGLMHAETDGTSARLLLAIHFEGNVGRLAVSPSAIFVTDPGKGTVVQIQK